MYVGGQMLVFVRTTSHTAKAAELKKLILLVSTLTVWWCAAK